MKLITQIQKIKRDISLPLSKCKKKCLTYFATIICLIIFLFTCCIQKSREPVRVGTSPWVGYSPFYWAREKGYFSKSEVKLTEYSSQTSQVRALVNGAIDAASVTLDTAIKLRSSGLDLKVILVIDYSNGGDVLLARPEFKRLQDLKGKRIGVETTALGDYMISRALEMGGMKLSEIEVVPLETIEHERAFKEVRIEAVVTYDPFRTKLLALGAKKLFDSSLIPGEIMDVLVVNSEFMKKGEGELRALIEGWFKALDDMKNGSNGAIQFMAKWEKMTDKEFIDGLKVVQLLDFKKNQNQLLENPPGILENGRRLQKLMFEKGLVDKEMNFENILDGRYIVRASK
jgi:NitT/TauT family transport system substrate-binding protein